MLQRSIGKTIFIFLLIFVNSLLLYSEKSKPMPYQAYRVLRISLDLTSVPNFSRFPKNYPAEGKLINGTAIIYAFFFPKGGPALFQKGWVTLKNYQYVGTCGGWIKVRPGVIGTTMYGVSFHNLLLKNEILSIQGKAFYPKWTINVKAYCPPTLSSEPDSPLFHLFAIFNENTTHDFVKYPIFRSYLSRKSKTYDNQKCFHNLIIDKMIIKVTDLGILHSIEELKGWAKKNHIDEEYIKSLKNQ